MATWAYLSPEPYTDKYQAAVQVGGVMFSVMFLIGVAYLILSYLWNI